VYDDTVNDTGSSILAHHAAHILKASNCCSMLSASQDAPTNCMALAMFLS